MWLEKCFHLIDVVGCVMSIFFFLPLLELVSMLLKHGGFSPFFFYCCVCVCVFLLLGFAAGCYSNVLRGVCGKSWSIINLPQIRKGVEETSWTTYFRFPEMFEVWTHSITLFDRIVCWKRRLFYGWNWGFGLGATPRFLTQEFAFLYEHWVRVRGCGRVKRSPLLRISHLIPNLR